MDAQDFTEHLRSGTGKPFIYAQSNDLSPFRDSILHACLHCYSVDPHSEGTRAGYMLELIDLTPNADFFKNKVLQSLSESGDTWDTVQRFHFVTYMAMDGHPQARQAIYNHFRPGPELGGEIAIDFLRLDGIEGLRFAAAKLGALLHSLLLTKPGKVELGHFWHQAEEICGEQEALSTISQAALTDPHVEAFRAALASKPAKPHPPIPLSYEALLPELPYLSTFQLWRWGQNAGPADLQAAARGLLEAQNPHLQRQHLRIFYKNTFPLHPKPLIELASSKDETLAGIAAQALANITNPAVRDLALQLITEQHPARAEAIALLAQNFQPSDHQLAISSFENEPDRDIRHGMQIGLREFWQRHPDPQSEPDMLHTLYNLGPCSFCREVVVQRLIQINALTPEMRQECAYDANEEIRSIVLALQQS